MISRTKNNYYYLWQRWLVVGLVVITYAFFASTTCYAQRRAVPTKPFDRQSIAVMLLVPDLGFKQLESVPIPALDHLADRGCVGMLNVRTVHRASVDEAFLTIGAGARANSSFCGEIGESVNRSEPFEGALGWQVYTRRTTFNPEKYRILALNLPQIEADSRVEPYDLQPGLLGDILKDSHISCAAIGNSDVPARPGQPLAFHREVVGAVMDHLGRVRDGDVSEGLLVNDPGAPFSVRMDGRKVIQEFSAIDRKRRFIAIEDGDFMVLHQSAMLFNGPALQLEVSRSVERLDRLIFALCAKMDFSRDMLIVCSPVMERSGSGNTTLTPIIAAGPGMNGGWISSESTRRSGLAVITDLAPTVAHFFAVSTPEAMSGSPLKAVSATRRWHAGMLWRLNSSLPPIQAVARLKHTLDELDSQRDDVERWYVYLCQLLIVICAVVVAWPGRKWDRKLHFSHWAALSVLALPLAMLTEPMLRPQSSFTAACFVFELTVLITAGVLSISKSRVQSVALMAWVVAGIVTIDLLMGQQGMITSMLSYAAAEASRYYGIGNEYMGVLVGAVITASCLTLGHRRYGALLAAIPLVAAVLLICMPEIGAKAGGSLVAVPSAAATIWILMGGRITWKTVIVLAVTGVVALSLMVAVDLSRGASMTHLGRAAQSVAAGGAITATGIAERKAMMEWRLIKYSPWSRTLLAAIIGVLMLRIVRRRAWDEMMQLKEINAAFSGLVVCAVTSLLFNDAGVLAAALSFVYAPALMAAGMKTESVL